MIILYIYLLGVILAFVTIKYAINRFDEKFMIVFVSNERIVYLALLSWIVVCGYVAAWLYDIIVYLYVYLRFRYLQLKRYLLKNHKFLYSIYNKL